MSFINKQGSWDFLYKGAEGVGCRLRRSKEAGMSFINKQGGRDFLYKGAEEVGCRL
jgi:hypothetical protein